MLVAVCGFEDAGREVGIVSILSTWSSVSVVNGYHSGDRHTSAKIWAITPSISSGVIVSAYSVASIISGPRTWMSLEKTPCRAGGHNQVRSS